ncbi:MAG: hypothetical protein ACR2I2_08685 [Bryobacteraceae bacterium]
MPARAASGVIPATARMRNPKSNGALGRVVAKRRSSIAWIETCPS